MKKLYRIIIVMAAALAVCGCLYDDSNLTERIDDFKNRIEALKNGISEMNASLEALGELTGGNVITSVMEDSDGNYVISYLDGSGDEKSVVIATASQMLNVPVLGVQLDPQTQIYWWTVTDSEGNTSFLMIDGKKVPVSGNAPEISVNEDGFWTVSGEVLKDSKGNPIEARDGESCIFRSVSVNSDGNLEMVLGNGKTVTLPVQNAFNLTLSAVVNNTVADASVPVVFSYDVSGSNADGAIVAIAEAEGLDASMDRENKKVTVTFPDGFTSGMLIMVGYDLADHTVIRPLFFSAGSQDARKGISTAEDLLAFASAVNSGDAEALAAFYDGDFTVNLLADIDCSSVTEWVPAGNAAHPFCGRFNGDGYKIKNLAMSFRGSDNVYGFFGNVGPGAIIENFVLGEGCSMTVSPSKPINCGTVAGVVSDAVIRDIESHAPIVFKESSITAASVRSAIGMIGSVTSSENSPVIENLVNYGNVNVVENANTESGGNCVHVAGVVAFANGKAGVPVLVRNCANHGDLNTTVARVSGILAGPNAYCSVSGCVNRGNVFNRHKKTGAGRLGNICCNLGNGVELTGCINYGDIVSASADRCGGICGNIGNATAVLSSCENYGRVISDEKTYRGTICGYFAQNIKVSSCIAQGDVGSYNGGAYQMEGVNPDNYFGYIGAMKAGCEHVTPMNIWWSADSVTAKDEFGTEPSDVSFTYTGGTAFVGLSSKTWDWTVSSSDSWLSLVDASGAEVRGGGMNASVQRLYVKAGLNMTSSVRTGTLTFSSVDGTQTATVNASQSPAVATEASKWVFTSTGTGKYTDFWTGPSHIIPATDGTSGTISAVRGEANAMVPFTYSVSSGKPYVGTLVKDDCLLFSMPVEGVEAGTWFQFNAIIGSKTNAHKYFVLEYLDGGQWKSVEGNLRTASEDASLKYTFMNSGVQSGTDYQHASVFQMFKVDNALPEGTLEVRLRAVGTYTCSGITESVSNTSADIFIPAFGFSGAYCSKIGTSAPKATRRVLALGNSFSYYNNPLWYLQEIAAREGNFVDLQGHVKGSQNLSQHAALSLSNEAVGLGGYDFAFLQDQSENPAIFALSGTASIRDAAVALADKVRAASPSCQVILENTWSFNGKAGSYGGSLASFDGYLASGTKAMAQAASAWVSPIGQAFARCRELYPSVNLYHTDNKHQSAYGAYLKACVNYLVLFGERFSSAPADCGINPQVAADLRGIAEEIVLGHEQDYLIVR
ncbi:MAG: hypothetical protein K1V99_08730 [Bacteroidales bacterium]|nr:PL29 family lyase N-terminal domain-containing protein [Bacteroidales bacterium]